MPILDIILLLCFIPAIVTGISKGFIKQAVNLASILIGAWAAFKFATALGGWLTQFFTMDEKYIRIICFFIILVMVTLLLNIIGELLTKMLKTVHLGWINGALGMLLGILKVFIILGLLITLFESLNASVHMVKPEAFENAAVYNALKEVGGTVFSYLKGLISDLNV